jgi:AP-2 complex subunit alpha
MSILSLTIHDYTSGLDMMNKLVRREGTHVAKGHQSTVLDSIKDSDVSVRKRALELLFSLTDEENASEIVSEMITNLTSADSQIKEDMVVKIAILAEKFGNN